MLNICTRTKIKGALEWSSKDLRLNYYTSKSEQAENSLVLPRLARAPLEIW